MALQNNSRIAEFTYKGETVRLQASLSNLRKLSTLVGTSGVTYIAQAEAGLDSLEEGFERICNIIHALDIDCKSSDPSEVEQWLFGNLVEFFADAERLGELGRVIEYVIGADVAIKLADVQTLEPDTKKKKVSPKPRTDRVWKPHQPRDTTLGDSGADLA